MEATYGPLLSIQTRKVVQTMTYCLLSAQQKSRVDLCSVETCHREKTGATIHWGQTSEAEIEWNQGEKESQCNDSAEFGRGSTKNK